MTLPGLCAADERLGHVLGGSRSAYLRASSEGDACVERAEVAAAVVGAFLREVAERRVLLKKAERIVVDALPARVLGLTNENGHYQPVRVNEWPRGPVDEFEHVVVMGVGSESSPSVPLHQLKALRQ